MSVHRGEVPDQVHPPGPGTPPGADTPWGADTPPPSRSRHPSPRADTPLGADTPPGADTPLQSMLGDKVNARVVRILLECNLVYLHKFMSHLVYLSGMVAMVTQELSRLTSWWHLYIILPHFDARHLSAHSRQGDIFIWRTS